MQGTTLHNYQTGDIIRLATETELQESIEAAKHDGGAGVIMVGDVRCYVMEAKERDAITTQIVGLELDRVAERAWEEYWAITTQIVQLDLDKE